MQIKKACLLDIPSLLEVYKSAKSFMRQNGNVNQWINGYPAENDIKKDIQNGNCYILLQENQIAGVFAFIIGKEPTYTTIENGTWHSTRPYGTIHRIASNGKTKGIARACFDFCKTKIDYLRIDTHKDNLQMQNAIKKYGFLDCGTIYLTDGCPRLAYDFLCK